MRMLVNLNRSSIVFILKLLKKLKINQKNLYYLFCFGLLKTTEVILVRNVKMSY